MPSSIDESEDQDKFRGMETSESRRERAKSVCGARYEGDAIGEAERSFQDIEVPVSVTVRDSPWGRSSLLDGGKCSSFEVVW